MTTIVIRDGVIAADSRAYSGARIPIGLKQKLHEMDDGSVVGVSSASPGLTERIAELIMQDVRDPDEFYDLPFGSNERKSFCALKITPAGEVFFYLDSLHPSGPLHGDYFAIGSGEEFALGALAFGASAEEAVRVAGELDQYTDTNVKSIRVVEKG